MGGILAAFKRGGDRYDVLLAILVMTVLVSPFESSVMRPAIIALLAAALVFVMWTSNAPLLALRLALGVSVAAVISAAVTQAGSDTTARVGFTVVGGLLCVATIGSTARALTMRIRDTARLLAGALSIYLLIGLLFAYLYGINSETHQAGFFAQAGPFDPTSYVYYSFITLTSVGFGDLTANNNAGRMLTVIEALMGQVYLVTVVAVVVTNRRPRRELGKAENEPESKPRP